MAKYGTKKYWQEEQHKEEVKFELMCRGFADVFDTAQSIAIEDIQEMVKTLWASSNAVDYARKCMHEASDTEEEDEE